MAKPSKKQIHSDLTPFAGKGGLFDVEPCELDLHVGRFGRATQKFLTENAHSIGTKHRERFEVVAIQKDYRGEVCYRVVFESDADRFGCVMKPGDVVLED